MPYLTSSVHMENADLTENQRYHSFELKIKYKFTYPTKPVLVRKENHVDWFCNDLSAEDKDQA